MNMTYCRFRNTLIDLTDCVNALRDGELAELSADELRAARELLKYAEELVSWKAEIEEFDPATVQTCNRCGERAGRGIFINDDGLCEECEEATAEEPELTARNWMTGNHQMS